MRIPIVMTRSQDEQAVIEIWFQLETSYHKLVWDVQKGETSYRNLVQTSRQRITTL